MWFWLMVLAWGMVSAFGFGLRFLFWLSVLAWGVAARMIHALSLCCRYNPSKKHHPHDVIKE